MGNLSLYIIRKLDACVTAKEEFKALTSEQRDNVIWMCTAVLRQDINQSQADGSEMLEDIANAVLEYVRNQQDDERLTVAPVIH